MNPYTPAYDDAAEKPLFGENTRRDRFANLIVGTFTTLVVTVTLICSFLFPSDSPPHFMSLFFAFTITLICGSHLVLIYWYRQGDLEPKFRNLIYFNAFNIILLCVVANLYFHKKS